MPIETLDELLIEEIKDIYDAEKQLTKALPKMARAASNADLKSAFTEHLEQTKGHLTRLDSVFELLGTKAKSKPCAAMKGLIQEGEEQTQEDAEGAVMDLMLIAAAQKVEHYEISAYGTVRAIAESIGNEEVSALLRQTEEEEAQADEKLSGIAGDLMGEVQGESPDEEEEVEGDKEEQLDDEEETVSSTKATVKQTATKKR